MSGLGIHGDPDGFLTGCRCELCRLAWHHWREPIRPLAALEPSDILAPCGTYSAYTRGCRCTDCRAASAEQKRALRARQRSSEAT